MKKAPEQYRYRKNPLLYSDSSYGNNGVFVIPHYKINDYELRCIISDMEGWEHVSVSVSKPHKEPTRCPTWEEMCYVKDMFWYDNETVIQYHPAKEDYVNMHSFVLHLWKPVNYILPKPNKLMVGL